MLSAKHLQARCQYAGSQNNIANLAEPCLPVYPRPFQDSPLRFDDSACPARLTVLHQVRPRQMPGSPNDACFVEKTKAEFGATSYKPLFKLCLGHSDTPVFLRGYLRSTYLVLHTFGSHCLLSVVAFLLNNLSRFPFLLLPCGYPSFFLVEKSASCLLPRYLHSVTLLLRA